MIEYGNGMKATSITKKQINVVYACAKRGQIKVQKWAIKEMYNLADYYNYDYNRSVEFEEGLVQIIIDCIFSENYEKAQQILDSTYDLNKYTSNFRKTADTSLL